MPLVRLHLQIVRIKAPPYFFFGPVSFRPSLRKAVAVMEGVRSLQLLSRVSPFNVELILTFLAAKSNRKLFTKQIGELSTAIMN